MIQFWSTYMQKKKSYDIFYKEILAEKVVLFN